jgi:chromosome segregation ATPase
MPTKKVNSKTLPSAKVTNAFKVAKEDAKKLVADATKKCDSAKKNHMGADKKLKSCQADLKKLEVKSKKDNSKSTAIRVTAAQKKLKQAELVTNKAKSAWAHAREIMNDYRDHLRKLEHLNQLVNSADRDWEQSKKTTVTPTKKKSAA